MMLKALLSFTGASILASQICYGITDQERKDDWNKPDSSTTVARGAKSSSSSSSSGSSSSSSSKSGNSNNSSSTPRFDYGQMSADFDKGLKKSTEEFMKSLPKSDSETYLKEMENANKMLGAASSNKDLSVESSLLAQYTATIISTIQQATQIKLNLLAQKEKQLLLEKNAQIKEQARQEKAERMVGLSSMAMLIGVPENRSSKTSPLSLRTQPNQGANHSSQNALFSRGITSITSRAYKSPEASD